MKEKQPLVVSGTHTYPENSPISHPWRCSWLEWRWKCSPKDECHWRWAWTRRPGREQNYLSRVSMCTAAKQKLKTWGEIKAEHFLHRKHWREWAVESVSCRPAQQCSSPPQGLDKTKGIVSWILWDAFTNKPLNTLQFFFYMCAWSPHLRLMLFCSANRIPLTISGSSGTMANSVTPRKYCKRKKTWRSSAYNPQRAVSWKCSPGFKTQRIIPTRAILHTWEME